MPSSRSLSLFRSRVGLFTSGAIVAATTFTVAVTNPGESRVGVVHTAAPSVTSGTISYQWGWLGDADISGATAATYTAVVADVGKVLVCKVTRNGTTVSGRSQYKVLQLPVLLEAFDSLTGFSTSNGVSTLNPSKRVQGSNAIQLRANGSSAAQGSLIKNSGGKTVTPSELGTIAFFMHTGDVLDDVGQTNGAGVRLATTGTLAYSAAMDPNPLSNAIIGGFWHACHVSEYSSFVSQPTGPLSMRLIPTHYAPYSEKVTLDSLMANAAGIPTVIIGMDDSIASQYVNARPIMLARNLPVTRYVVQTRLGLAGCTTMAQELDWFSTGLMDFQVDGTNDDTIINTKADLATWRAELLASMDWAQAACGVRPNALCYPNGSFSGGTGGGRVQFATAVSDGSNIVTVPSTTGVDVGWTAYGYIIPDGTTITAVQDATHLVLSNNIPANASFNFASSKLSTFSYELVRQTLIDLGIRSARTTNQGPYYDRFGVAGRAHLLSGESTTGGIDLTPAIQKCILRGTTMEIYYHGVTDDTASNLSRTIAQFTSDMDYLATLRDAGTIRVITKRQQIANWDAAVLPI